MFGAPGGKPSIGSGGNRPATIIPTPKARNSAAKTDAAGRCARRFRMPDCKTPSQQAGRDEVCDLNPACTAQTQKADRVAPDVEPRTSRGLQENGAIEHGADQCAAPDRPSARWTGSRKGRKSLLGGLHRGSACRGTRVDLAGVGSWVSGASMPLGSGQVPRQVLERVCSAFNDAVRNHAISLGLRPAFDGHRQLSL